jgi:mycothiol synthase
VLGRALPAELVDDRFELWPGGESGTEPGNEPAGFGAALATVGSDPVGFLGGSVTRSRLQLDGLIDPRLADPDDVLARLYDALRPTIGATGARWLELWGRPARPWHESLAHREQMAPFRALHQMRCPLPLAVDPVPTRSYRPDRDLEAVRAVNNRAFAHHPDQGAKTAADLGAIMAEPWFRPDGLRIYERDGRMAGFCWTKIHSDPDPARRLGEIYVIGVDPDFHGQGLGGPMTAAGLQWLSAQGITTGMLYVEADNEPAVRTYLRLGFTTVRTDRAWEARL